MNLQLILVVTIIVAAVTVNEANASKIKGCINGDGKNGPGRYQYTGTYSYTESGRKCQSWGATSPHNPNEASKVETNYPNGSIALSKNYCRNPTGYGPGLWCYTTDPDKRWELCDIPSCPPKGCINGDGKGAKGKFQYDGTYSYTVSGRECQAWTATAPHKPNTASSQDKNYPGGSKADSKNYCRNPAGWGPGLWCYTTDPNKRWELCDIPSCPDNCIKGNGKGAAGRYQYTGTHGYTETGRKCQSWSATSPHNPSKTSSKDKNYPPGGRDASKNYCRNPTSYGKGLWCYTTDPKKRWELCDIPSC